MKLGIVGSRQRGTLDDYRIICSFIRRLKPNVIISGGAKGIDTTAEKAAYEFGIKTEIYLPKLAEYPTKGNYVYYERNRLIAKASDILLAFPANKISGTDNTIKWFRELKPKNRLIIIREGGWKE